jgi:hypothetical protein
VILSLTSRWLYRLLLLAPISLTQAKPLGDRHVQRIIDFAFVRHTTVG